MTLWDTHRTKGRDTQNTYEDAVTVKHLIGFDMHIPLRIGFHIGTKGREGAEMDQTSQTVLIGIELMVAHDSGVETHLIHQCHHRIGWNLKHIVDRITRTVVACREDQQARIKCTKRISDITKAWELLYSCVWIIDTKDMELTTLLS